MFDSSKHSAPTKQILVYCLEIRNTRWIFIDLWKCCVLRFSCGNLSKAVKWRHTLVQWRNFSQRSQRQVQLLWNVDVLPLSTYVMFLLSYVPTYWYYPSSQPLYCQSQATWYFCYQYLLYQYLCTDTTLVANLCTDLYHNDATLVAN